jgi:antitoxin component of MazEF toxin-antitoxin module
MIMKRHLHYLSFALGLLVLSITAVAEVGLNTFEPGTPILAEDVNANFRALAEALEARQVRIDGGCEVGMAIRAINPDGTVACEVISGEVGEVGSLQRPRPSVVESLNEKRGHLTLQAGDNIAIDNAQEQTIVISTSPQLEERLATLEQRTEALEAENVAQQAQIETLMEQNVAR